ncbi:MAG: ATP-binding cassette domain-containing protein [Synergistaceae bacterium]|nr:ATP-binding cassette domain-containing protein [Synergistaceae bacterium]
MNDAFISIENVSKSFDPGKKDEKKAVKNISATISAGYITGLAGADGAGKTTLLRLICGLFIPDSGVITVDGYDTVRDSDSIHSILGYMPQKFGLYEDLTVMENLELHAALRNIPTNERKSRYDEILSFTSLLPFTRRLAGRLSGGMKQKLGLGCTLLSKPAILLMDEPGVGVDPLARRELWRMVRSLTSERRAVVWSTAYLEEAEMCDTVILMNEGDLIYKGAPKELSAQMKGNVFLIDGAGSAGRKMISAFMEKENTIDAVIQGSKVRVVTKDKGGELQRELQSELPNENLKIESTEPRFEDAYIKILGGARKERADISAFFKTAEGKSKDSEIVRAENLTKKFGDFTAVDNISFSVKKGEIFGLLGPNGAGKSTTFKMMCGLLTPTTGNCSISGRNFKDAPGEARSRLGYMAQKFSLYSDMSVIENLDFFSGVYGLKGKERKNIIELVTKTFELRQYMNALANSLPLGIKQRLAMGCSLMHGPDVLFLDEPTSGVDPVTRREFWSYINSAALKGITIMVTTHFMDEAEYCDRIALIFRGKTISLGSPDQLKASAATNEDPDPTLEEAFIKLIEND